MAQAKAIDQSTKKSGVAKTESIGVPARCGGKIVAVGAAVGPPKLSRHEPGRPVGIDIKINQDIGHNQFVPRRIAVIGQVCFEEPATGIDLHDLDLILRLKLKEMLASLSLPTKSLRFSTVCNYFELDRLVERKLILPPNKDFMPVAGLCFSRPVAFQDVVHRRPGRSPLNK